jgi:hypothetical protein
MTDKTFTELLRGANEALALPANFVGWIDQDVLK